ncbi:MAG: hypothetical protein QJR09_06315 [Micrococcus sp.]|nr:hypothetical protein [Micrococcus sp.]
MKLRTRTVTALALGFTVLAATGCAGGPTTPPDPTVTVTAAASVPEWTRSVNPEWDFLTAIRSSGMDFTRDWEADLEALGVDLAETDTFQLRSQVCGTAMDDGEGDYNPASRTHEFWLSSFYDEVRRMGRGGAWDVPRTVAYHHCPSRFEAVGAVQELEARSR